MYKCLCSLFMLSWCTHSTVSTKNVLCCTAIWVEFFGKNEFLTISIISETSQCNSIRENVLHKGRLLGLTTPATVSLQYLHWPRSGVWRLRVVTAEGGMTEYGVTAVSWCCSSSDAGQQGAAVTLLGAGEGLAISWEQIQLCQWTNNHLLLIVTMSFLWKTKKLFFSWTKLSRFSRQDQMSMPHPSWTGSNLD